MGLRASAVILSPGSTCRCLRRLRAVSRLSPRRHVRARAAFTRNNVKNDIFKLALMLPLGEAETFMTLSALVHSRSATNFEKIENDKNFLL